MNDNQKLEHIQHIYEDEELEKEAICRNLPTGSPGGQKFG